jgi:hypothetical protein
VVGLRKRGHIFPSLIGSQSIRQIEAGLLPGRNDRRKVNLIQIKAPQYFAAFSAI